MVTNNERVLMYHSLYLQPLLDSKSDFLNNAKAFNSVQFKQIAFYNCYYSLNKRRCAKFL